MGDLKIAYTNGNYKVFLFKDGTKIRYNHEDKLVPDFPESMDIKITNQCDLNCPMCHEKSTHDGVHGDILNLPFLETLHAGTELAIGGGNPLAHPDLIPFLEKCHKLRLEPSITINYNHLRKERFGDKYGELLDYLMNNYLINGVGLSVERVNQHVRQMAMLYPNTVVHFIAGYTPSTEFAKLAGCNAKILILGFKCWGRGADYVTEHDAEIEKNIAVLRELLPIMIKEEWFKVISFDNLALEQLSIREIVGEEEWNKRYMGTDGFATMYIDAVKREFARSSTYPIRYPITDNIKDMFDKIRVI